MPEASESAPIEIPFVRKGWSGVVLVAAVVIAGAVFLATVCLRSPNINFLPRDGRAEWILFPATLSARGHPAANLDATFRREFALDSEGQPARLHVRAAKQVELRINGVAVELGRNRNWKFISSVDVGGFLRTGANTIEARVFNGNAPPSLWLVLDAGGTQVRTDQSWQASFAGSVWRSAISAATPRTPGPGNLIAGGEETLRAFAKVWPTWLLFAGVSFLVITAARWWSRKIPGDLSRRQIVILLLGLASLCMILLWHNAPSLSEDAGFDVRPHYDYIEYVQKRHALPLPNEGYEMFHPPLYYVLSAAVLSLGHISADDPSMVPVLRTFSMLYGIAHFILVFLCLRLVFPRQLGAQTIGLLVAAFLPMQLYLSHYVTNETLAAPLATATIYFALRLLKTNNAPLSIYIWTGLCMGAAILAKATGLMLVPATVAALIFNLARQRSSFATGFRNLGVMLAICFAICGWYYIWVWRHFGTPLVGNWEPATGFAWWQDTGYHMAADYFRFGRALINPLFSGFAGFFDGIYSTLWGDSLCGGTAEIALRPPWNYNFIAAGYLLALIPTLLILVGAMAAVRRFVRVPSAELLMILGFSATVAVGLIFLTLKLACYAQIKAFYGLFALVPLCVFVGIGWQILARCGKAARFAFAIVLLVWATNSFASYWIQDPASEHILAALKLRNGKRADEAIVEARKAVDLDPTHRTARRLLIQLLNEAGRTDQVLEQTRRDVQLTPLDSESHERFGEALFQQGDVDAALSEGRRALELGPENPAPYQLLFACFRRSQREPEAIAVARDGLAVSPYDPDFHYRLGLVLAQETNYIDAINHFAYAMLLGPDPDKSESKLRLALSLLARAQDSSAQLQKAALVVPDSPRALNDLAWLFATHPDMRLRNGEEATRLAKRASVSNDRKKKPAFLATLSAAYAETGNFPDAIQCAQESLSLAESSGDADTVALSQKLLTSFQANSPYRDETLIR
jgi:tetratricopeptide (TPR) repeat protein